MLAQIPDFHVFLRLQPFDPAFPGRKKRELAGDFDGKFSPRTTATRNADTRRSSPPQPTKKIRRPLPASLVPRSSLPRSLFLTPSHPRSGRIFQGMAHIDAAGRVAADAGAT